MICPLCKSELILGKGTKRYETLIEHVEDPNGIPCEKPYYICSNKKCESRSFVFWDDMGDSYIKNDNYFEMKEKYPDTTPLDSWKKQQEIEIEKHDEDFTFLNLYFIRWRIKFEYKADTFGHILKRIPKVEINTRYHGVGWCVHTSDIHMYFYCLKSFKRLLDLYNKDSNNSYAKHDLEREFAPDYDRRPYKIIYKWWINLKYKNVKNMLILDKLFSK